MRGNPVNGMRPEIMSLVVARILIAAVVILVQHSYWPASPVLVLAITISLFGWAALALAAFLLAWPRSRDGFAIALLLDLVFACCIAALGDPVLGFAILPFSAAAWRSVDGWRLDLVAVGAYALMCVILWNAGQDNGAAWPLFPPEADMLLAWVGLGAGAAGVFWLSDKRRDAFMALKGEDWVDAILDTDRPFLVDFSSWTRKVAALYGDDECLCAIILIRRDGSMSICSNAPADRLRTEAAVLGKGQEDLLPGRLSILRDRQGGDHGGPTVPPPVQHLLSLLGQPVVMGRQFPLGHQNGLLIIAHHIANDAILTREMESIDLALDDLLQRLDRVIEMRRDFLIEAREVARRDLHDGVLQSLAALRMRLMTILQAGDLAETEAAKEIRNIADIVALEQARLRSMLDAKSDADQPINLVEALRIAVATTALQWEIDIEFACEEQAVPMHRESVSNVEFLLREIIANATRHSGAKRLRCSLAIRQSDLVISLLDRDGDDQPGALEYGPGPLASESLQQRLALVNGRAYSEGLQSGTLLAIAIPLVYDDHIHV